MPQEALQDAFEAAAEAGAAPLSWPGIASRPTSASAGMSGATGEFGNLLGQLIRPLDRVGLYVPGGRQPILPPLMTAVPAKVWGARGSLTVLPLAACLIPSYWRSAPCRGAPCVPRGRGSGNAALAFARNPFPR